MYKIIAALIIMTLVFFACDTVEEEKDYTYSIAGIWWSDSLDGNQDGYVSFKRLNVNVHLEEDVSRDIDVQVYYKLKQASNFTYYPNQNIIKAAGNNTDNIVSIPIGNPVKNLPRGEYDFLIEIYEKNNDRLEAASDTSFPVLFNNLFEESSTDSRFAMSVSWVNTIDRNKNGYWRSAGLKVDVDIEGNLQKSISVKILYRKDIWTEYETYQTVDDYKITGKDTLDAMTVNIGVPDQELEFGKYDFRIELREFGKDFLVGLLDESLPELNDVGFESEDDDTYYYSIARVWWSDSIDSDMDGYTSLRKLHFDADVDKNESRSVFAKLYARDIDTTDYSIIDSTVNFTILGTSTSDAQWLFVGLDSHQLDSNKYDFLLALFEIVSDTHHVVGASVSGLSDSTLYQQNFESTSQDSL